MHKRAKLTAPKGLRLNPHIAEKLAKHSGERHEEELEIIRRALVTELERLDALIPNAIRTRLDQLAAAGLDFDKVVEDALARKAMEDAQLKMAAIIPDTREPVHA